MNLELFQNIKASPMVDLLSTKPSPLGSVSPAARLCAGDDCTESTFVDGCHQIAQGQDLVQVLGDEEERSPRCRGFQKWGADERGGLPVQARGGEVRDEEPGGSRQYPAQDELLQVASRQVLRPGELAGSLHVVGGDNAPGELLQACVVEQAAPDERGVKMVVQCGVLHEGEGGDGRDLDAFRRDIANPHSPSL